MPKRTRSDDSKSRSKASATYNSVADRPRKRRRGGKQGKPQERNPNSAGNSFSALLNVDEADKVSNVQLDQSLLPHAIEQTGTNNMASPGFGRNRLASGFPTMQMKDEKNKQTNPFPTSVANFGESSASPIEISDDEMQESEGGILINLDQDTSSPLGSLTHSSDEESGEIVVTPKDDADEQTTASGLYVVDSTSATPIKRLLDLSPEEQDEQFKYAFFHLDRALIDLSRPVVCLNCSGEGHLHRDCDPAIVERFPPLKIRPETRLKLWISCCICASKLHLVGDCPRSRGERCERWSLKNLDAEQITNLSLEKGMGRLEKNAENAGMRPPGLQIKGRAGLHRRGIAESEGSRSDNDEPLVRNVVARQSQFDRYDRFNPPAGDPPHRGGGQWYATDSFGRQRSRSPDERYGYRPRDGHGRPPAHNQRENWRPGPAEHRNEPRRPRQQSPPRRNHAPTAQSRAPPPNSGIQFSLPSRKGSATWSQNGQTTKASTSSNRPRNNQSKQQPARHKKKGKKGS